MRSMSRIVMTVSKCKVGAPSNGAASASPSAAAAAPSSEAAATSPSGAAAASAAEGGQHAPSHHPPPRKVARNAFLVAILCSTALLAARPARAQDFYDEQLRAGRDSFQAGRTLEAADELRIAAFGLLDRPQLLSEALVRLAIAQSSLGNSAAVAHTLGRFLDVESRFQMYAKLTLDPPTRSAFETLLKKSVPRATIAAVPSLAALLDTDQQRIARLPRPERLRALEAAVLREPKNAGWPLALAREYAATGEGAAVIRWAGLALELDKNSGEARALLAHARAARGECREALALLARLAAADLQQRPELLGDQVVCLVELKRWGDAQTAMTRLPEGVKSRDDVKRAAQKMLDQSSSGRKPGRAAAGTKGDPDVAKPPATAAARAGNDGVRPVNAGSVEPADSAREVAPPRSIAASRASDGSPARNERFSPSVNEVVRRQSAHVLEQSRQLVNEGKYQNAMRVLVGAVQDDPSNRELRRALLESSVLASDWRTASAQAGLVSPFAPGEELSMFYASVALYESGKKDEARRLMERAQSHMSPSPFADYYIRVILAQ
jgi:tetratricopeptide (TPR) repeat protein